MVCLVKYFTHSNGAAAVSVAWALEWRERPATLKVGWRLPYGEDTWLRALSRESKTA